MKTVAMCGSRRWAGEMAVLASALEKTGTIRVRVYPLDPIPLAQIRAAEGVFVYAPNASIDDAARRAVARAGRPVYSYVGPRVALDEVARRARRVLLAL